MFRKSNYLLWIILCSVLTTLPLGSTKEPEYSPFIYGTTSEPVGFDPLGVYDTTSRVIIQNCFEGLFRSDYTSPNGEVIPVLAFDMGTWNVDLTEWTIRLREDVQWWDGSTFSAEDVVWNLNRLNTLSETEHCEHASLWFTTEDDLIIKTIEAPSQYEVKLTLSQPWLDIEKLLAFWGSFFIKPMENYTHNVVPKEKFDELIGTGPFMFNSYEEGESTILVRNDNYWRGPANIHELIIQVFPDGTTMTDALIQEEIVMSRGIYFDKWTEALESPHLDVEVVKESCVYFFHMSDLVKYDIRRAMQFAYNYSYNEQEYFRGIGFQTTHPIPIGMEGYNPDLPGLPYFDLDVARNYILSSEDSELQAAVSANHLTKDSSTVEWRMAAEGDYPIDHYNFTSYGTSLYTQLADNAKDIGVRIDHDVFWPIWYFDDRDEDPLKFDFLIGGWCPDYYDPVNMLEPIFATGAPLYWNRLANATIDANMAALHTLSGEEKLAKVDEVVTQIIVEQALALYFIQAANLFAWNSELITDGIDTFFNIQGDKPFYELTYTLSRPINPGISGFPLVLVVVGILGISALLCQVYRNKILTLH